MSEDSSLSTSSSFPATTSKDQQNASKLAIEAAEAEATNNSSSSSKSSSSQINNKQQASQISSSSSSSSSPLSSSAASSSSPASASLHQQQQISATKGRDTTSTTTTTTSEQMQGQQQNEATGEAGAQPEAGAQQEVPQKKFSEKTLDELADYYLNFKPSEIPDSGFVVSGIAGRFPNADNLNELWDNLYHARDMVCGPDDKRWPLGLWDLPKKAARVKDISLFDNEFFGIPKETADYTDHQLRNLYEVIYESMLDAGLNPAQIRGDKKCGIFFGFHTSETDVEFMEKPNFQTTGYQSQLLTAVTSYFDIRGVAASYDAACASSFAAFHQALLNLRSGLVDTAIVCGVNISVRPGTAYQFLLLQMLSPTGSSKFLDASADGYAKTEACVSVILQRKDIAKRSYAAIVHTKCNNDGFKIEGITFPSSKVQEALMMDAITEAGVNPHDIVYVEAHGTGTPAGDPEEARAIAKIFADEGRKEPLLIGSVKSNMGHAEGVSGLCSLAKVICTFENELLPCNLHYKNPNPNIQPLVDGRIVPVDKNIPFKHNLIPMNCYGFGGVNVHGIFKSHTRKQNPAVDYQIAPEFPRLITMFGRSQKAVEYAFEQFKRDKDEYGRRLLTRDYLSLVDTINEGQIDKLMNYRGYLLVDNELNEVAQSVVQMDESLPVAYLNGTLLKNDKLEFSAGVDKRPPHFQDHERQLWFILPGLGCQWRAMAKNLQEFKPFWKTIESLANVLKQHGVDLLHVLTNDSENVFEDNVVNLFTGIVAVQIALIDLLRLLEVKPKGIIGHSIGEISCAYADGLLNANETILLAYHLAKPIDEAKMHSGAMAAASLSVRQAEQYIATFVEKQRAKHGKAFKSSIEIACVNGDESLTLSGDREEIDQFIDILTEENIYARRITDVKTPFHNSSLRSIEKELIRSVQKVFNNNEQKVGNRFKTNSWFSSLYPNQSKKSATNSEDGQQSQEQSSKLEQAQHQFEISAQYYVENLCSQVQFNAAMSNIIKPEQSIIIEIAPHGLFQPILKQKYLTKLNYVSLMKRMDGSVNSLLKSLGQLYQRGQSLKLSNLYPKVEFPVAKGTGSVSSIIRWNHDQKFHVAKYPEAFRRPPCEARVKFDLIDESDKYLSGHCVDGRILFPATGYLYLVWRSYSLTMDKVGDSPIKQTGEAILVPVEFNNVRLYRATILGSAPVELLVRIEEATGQFEVREGGSVVVDGYISLPKVNPDGMQYEYIKNNPDFKDKPMSLTPEDVYKQFRVCGYDYGESFRNIVSASDDGLHVQVKWSGQFIPFSDSVLQSLFLAICKKTSALFLPTKFEYMRINPKMLQAKVDAAAAENKPCILDAYCELKTGIIVTDGIEMRGIGASPAPRRLQQEPVLESYQFISNMERCISDRLSEQLDAKVEQYMEMCSTAAYKILSNLQQSKSQINAVIKGFNPVDDAVFNKYLDDHDQSEQHILLQILDKILASQEQPPEPEIVRGGLEEAPAEETKQDSETKAAAAADGDDGAANANDAESENKAKTVVKSGPTRERKVDPKLRDIEELKSSFEKTVKTEFEALANKLGHDLLSSAFGRERFLRSLLEIAFENTPSQKLKLLELNSGNGIKFEPIAGITGEIAPNLSINYFLGHPATNTLPASELPQDTKLYTWNPSYRTLQRDLQDLDVVVYNDSSLYPTTKDQFTSERLKTEEDEVETDEKIIQYEDVEGVFQSVNEVLRSNGFFLVLMRSQLSPAEKLLYNIGQYELDKSTNERLESIFEAGRKANMHLIAEKSDKTGCHLLLFRKLDPKITLDQQQLIHIEDGKQANWLEAVKKVLNDIKALSAADAANKNVWLIANDTSYNGLVGFVNCLRKEPGGERIRMLLDQRADSNIRFGRKELDFERIIKPEKEGEEEKKETVKSDAFIDLETVKDPFLLELIKQDLVYNCIDQEGRYGSFRHFMISDLLESLRIKTDEAFVNVATRGDLSSFRWYEAPYKYIDPKVREDSLASVYYASLNFRDIMLASGRLPLDALPVSIALSDCILGLEFSGRLASGRRVAGMIGGRGISTKALIAEDQSISFTIPDNISLEEAATIPVVYGTAVMALISRGRMKRGESILIHSGSGGVGQAAIRLCLHHGLTVYTTVGNQEKRDFLKEEFPQLTDAHIFNSRTCQFETDIMKATRGRGVDLVLNSLSEDKLQASVRCLADGGRFLEIGKYDMALNNPVELISLDTNKTFHGILLDKLFDTDTLTDVFVHQRHEMIEIIEKGLAEGYIKPIRRTVFDRSQVEDAFRFMASGKHIGKVIIKIRDEESDADQVGSQGNQLYKKCAPYPLVVEAQPRTMFNPVMSYIITGGLGGFGLELAKWMATNGARNLILTSRTGIRSGYQKLVVERLNQHGVNVQVSSVDNTTDEGAEQMIREALAIAPLGGIFNLAMVLRDSLFENATVDDFNAVCLPKCLGVAALDRATRKLVPDLSLFVAFSSVSCGKGNPGQANYGYANSVMERICEQRRRDGLHGLAIQWGAIGDVGVAFENLGGNEAVIGGTIPQRMPSCFMTLSKLLASPFSVCLSILQADRRSFSAGKKGDLVKTILHVLGIKDPSTVDPNCTLGELGLDSLMAVEIRQALEREYDIVLTVQEIRALTINRIREIGEGEGKKKSSAEEAGDKNMLPVTDELGLTGAQQNCVYATETNVQLSPIVSGVNISTSATGQKLFTINKELASKPPLVLASDDLIVLNGDTGNMLIGNPIFILPPIQGDFSRLSLLCKKFTRPCVGVCWTSRMAPCSNVDDVVKEHVRVIRHYYPQLKQLDMIGYSFGAAIAFEIMCHIQQNKLTPPLHSGKLILLDGSPDMINIGVRYITNTIETTNETERAAEVMTVFLMQHHRFDYADLKKKLLLNPTNETKLRYATDLLAKTLGLKEEAQIKQIEFAIEAYCRRFQMMLAYEKKETKLDSDVTLIRATEVYVGAKDHKVDEDYGLSSMVSGRVNSCLLKGNHESFLDDNVDQISSLLQDVICPVME